MDNRNWEIGDPAIIRRLSQSRAIALDMESAAIAANGFRFRVPFGTLLCVSDKSLHGEIKLAGMAGEFYRQRVGEHLEIGLKALEKAKNSGTGALAFAQAPKLCRGCVPIAFLQRLSGVFVATQKRRYPIASEKIFGIP